jgi:cell division protein FtsA
MAIKGLAEAHATPGFSTLAGLVLHAAADPVDIRRLSRAQRRTTRFSGSGLMNRVLHALKEYF